MKEKKKENSEDKKKQEKIPKRKITFEIPESTYQLMKKAVVMKNTTIDLAKNSLAKISDIAREAMINGLVAIKEIQNEADKRLKKKAKKETKELNE